MDLLCRADLETLIATRSGPCISFYLPTHRTGKQREQDPIRFKNQLRDAQQELINAGMRAPAVSQLLEQAIALRADDFFWGHQSDGLAMFCAAGFASCFRLPMVFDESMHIGPHFSLRPLLPLVAAGEQFFVLALSTQAVRLFQATDQRIDEVRVDALPGSLEDVLQSKSASPSSELLSGRSWQFQRSRAEYQPDEQITEQDLVQYLQRVDHCLQTVLDGQQAPLVLASVGYLAGIYESVNSYPCLIRGKVPGNPELWSLEELQVRARRLVQPYFQQDREAATASYWQAIHRSRASNDIKQIVLAAEQGRVHLLFLDRQCRQYGLIDPAEYTVRLLHPSDPNARDLLELAAVKTLIHGGTLYLGDSDSVPGGKPPVAAVFRNVA